MLNDTQTDKIRSLNENFRRNPRGVTCLEPDRLAELLEAVRRRDSFTRDNDPHGEHDFGAIDESRRCYGSRWKGRRNLRLFTL
ncbi:DUF3768 domain-containing protein [Bradyrhizobium cosmicum]|uniref:DUF3768 domain-containing protein n=1 Tax=Bradyrhizobium cosmicum TaxID=1404864 RepID=UPI0028F05AC5|nr:DUF3768 domain-containing protein [Bradyrhizobium cosmicum]